MNIEDIRQHLDSDKLAEFWKFVDERQRIYVRRFRLKQDPPWTEDSVLQKVFFTNVYRELDVGTQYLFLRVLDKGTELEELFEILVYRQFNNRYTYEALSRWGRNHGDWSDWAEIGKFLKAYSLAGKTVFSEAHMTTGAKWGGFDNKIDNTCWMLSKHWYSIDKIYHSLMSAKSLKDLCGRIAELEGYGSFLAYEVATDLGYSKRLRRFSEDDWANPGPGCRRAIDVLLPARRELKINYEDVILFLRKNQRDYFTTLGLDFPFLGGKELTLRNVEHSLCEFFKYNRAKYTGKARRNYRGGRP